MPQLRSVYRRQPGFTLVELIMVIVLLSVLSFTVFPRLNSSTFSGMAFHDEAVAALRFAQKSAVSHRRLTCAEFTATTVSLTIAATRPATACAAVLNGPDGPQYATSRDTSAVFFAPVPNTLYFQPSGEISSDGAGSSVVSAQLLKINGQTDITVWGATGHVE